MSIYIIFLVIIILLTKLNCLRKVFILYIEKNSTSLPSNLNTYIVFQSFSTILLLNTSSVLFFTNCVCIFAILSIIILNFSTSNIQRNFFQNIFKKKLKDFTYFLYLSFGNLIYFLFLYFFTVIIAMILELVFIVFNIVLCL